MKHNIKTELGDRITAVVTEGSESKAIMLGSLNTPDGAAVAASIAAKTAKCHKAGKVIEVRITRTIDGESTLVADYRSWITYREYSDASKSGADRYVWSKDGNRTKHDRVLITVDGDGAKTEEVLGVVYRATH